MRSQLCCTGTPCVCEKSFDSLTQNATEGTEGALHALRKVRNHDHLTGHYRGTAHNKCNLNCKQKQSNFVPILFHNFSGYEQTRQHVWCEDCNKNISDKTRHFQSDSEIYSARTLIIRSQQNQKFQQNHQLGQDTQSASGVKTIVNEKTYKKREMNTTGNLEH